MTTWVAAHIATFLYATGALTAGAIALAFFPERVLAFLGQPPSKHLAVRQAGILIGVLGAGIVWAARDPAAHRAVIAMALAEKAGLVALVALEAVRAKVSVRLAAVAAFDAACVAVFAMYLVGS